MWKLFFALITIVSVAQTLACDDHPAKNSNVFNSASGGQNVFFSNIDDTKPGVSNEVNLDDAVANIPRPKIIEGIYQNSSND